MNYLTLFYVNSLEGSARGAASGIITAIIEILKGVRGKRFTLVWSDSIAKFDFLSL